MRLIDIDNFTNNLRLLLNRSFLGEISPHESIYVGEIATLIKNEPTAYDADKVVEQLETNSMYTHESIEPYIALDDAIEIVKSGGIEQR